jgi:hypothetical protein
MFWVLLKIPLLIVVSAVSAAATSPPPEARTPSRQEQDRYTRRIARPLAWMQPVMARAPRFGPWLKEVRMRSLMQQL